MTSFCIRLLLGTFAILQAPACDAALTVNVTGVIVEGICEINNGDTIHVDFGNNIQSKLIDGEHFMQNIDYSLSCEDLISNDLEMQFEGTAVSYNDDYLATDREGLSIKLYMNGKLLPLNTWMPFTWPEVPVLQAVPMKDDATEVENGVFIASATLKIQYQ